MLSRTRNLKKEINKFESVEEMFDTLKNKYTDKNELDYQFS